MSLYLVVLLVSIVLASFLALGAPAGAFSAASVAASESQLPSTVPGLTRDEGVFLVTAADDGSRATYFIAQNTRHSIMSSDLQLETALNPLWPQRPATRAEVLAFPEAAPVGGAKSGLIKFSAPAEVAADEELSSPVAETPSPVAEESMAELPTSIAATPGPMPGLPLPSGMPQASAPAHPQLGSVEPSQYVLQGGDNLTRISARYGTTVEAIIVANGISTPNRIYSGQSLVIPGPAARSDVVEWSPLSTPTANNILEPVADTLSTDAAAPTYTVKRGDSAIGIARQFGVDVDELLAINTVANRNRIYAGDVLTLPGL